MLVLNYGLEPLLHSCRLHGLEDVPLWRILTMQGRA